MEVVWVEDFGEKKVDQSSYSLRGFRHQLWKLRGGNRELRIVLRALGLRGCGMVMEERAEDRHLLEGKGGIVGEKRVDGRAKR